MLVMTHKLVKGLGDPIELRLGEAGMEGEGEGVLEGVERSREASPVTVGGQQRERVGADLGLDPLGAQSGEHVVATVELDHVGLPAMDVARVGGREQQGQMGEPLGVALRDPRALGEQLVEAPPKPRPANSSRAASRMSSRRSALLFLVETVFMAEIVSDHS